MYCTANFFSFAWTLYRNTAEKHLPQIWGADPFYVDM